MSFSPRVLLMFFGRFFALLLIFAPIWYWLALFYAGILVGVGNSTLSLLGYPPLLSLHDREIVLTMLSHNVRVSTEITSLYGVPLLLALVWAAPMLPRHRRTRLSLLGLGSMALIHWLNLLCQAGVLLAHHWFWKLVAQRLFLVTALGDMLVPALGCLGLALHASHDKTIEERRKPDAQLAPLRR
ncbi:MAG: hypothetical protein ACK4HB_08125 [Candidatus Bipolaricaulia bacterium]